MEKTSRAGVIVAVSIGLSVWFGAFAYAQTQSKVATTVKKETKMTHASGELK